MPRNPDTSNVSRREFLAVAGAVAAASPLAAGMDSNLAQAASSHVKTPCPVTMTSDAVKKTIKYSSPCSSDASSLYVNSGDVVTWKAKTSGKKHHSAIFFSPTTPFVDQASGDPVYSFHGSEADEAGGIGGQAMIGPDASGEYKYTVLIFDEMNDTTYTDDPKIIVGSGMAIARVELTAALAEIKKAKALLSGKPAVERQTAQIASIEHELAEVIEQLK